jgi:hypothetical protein
MGTHSFIHYFVTVTVTSLLTAVTNKFLFSSACNEVMEAIGDLKTDLQFMHINKENNEEPFLLIFSRKNKKL